MITFHVSRELFTQFKREGKMTIVRDRVKSWTDQFKTELGMTFPDKVGREAAKYEGVAKEAYPVCMVKLQNINEVLNATIVSVCLEQDHLGKWKYMITLACIPEWNEDSADNDKRSLTAWSQLLQIFPSPDSRKKVCAVASVLAVLTILTLLYVLFF